MPRQAELLAPRATAGTLRTSNPPCLRDPLSREPSVGLSAWTHPEVNTTPAAAPQVPGPSPAAGVGEGWGLVVWMAWHGIRLV